MTSAENPRSFFIDQPKKDLVTDSRQQAVHTAPPPSPIGARVKRWKIERRSPSPGGKAAHPLFFEVALDVASTKPDFAVEAARAKREAIINTVCQQFLSLRETTVVLNEIAAFPQNIVLAPGQQLDAENARLLSPVEKIAVTFWFAGLPGRNSNEDVVGYFDPESRAAEYQIAILLDEGEPSMGGAQYWPCQRTSGSDCVAIRYAHKSAAARMMSTLAHELLHVWFAYKFSLANVGGTGHGGYDRADSGFFFDRVATGLTVWPGGTKYAAKSDAPEMVVPKGLDLADKPFLARLANYYKQIDAADK